MVVAPFVSVVFFVHLSEPVPITPRPVRSVDLPMGARRSYAVMGLPLRCRLETAMKRDVASYIAEIYGMRLTYRLDPVSCFNGAGAISPKAQKFCMAKFDTISKRLIQTGSFFAVDVLG